MLSKCHSLNLKLCSKQYNKIFVLHLIVAPQLGGGCQHNFSTKTRQTGNANEQSMNSLMSMLQGQSFARYKTKTRPNLNFWELSVEDERAVVDAPRRAAHLELVGVDRRQVVHDVLKQKKWKILINIAACFLDWHRLYKATTKNL